MNKKIKNIVQSVLVLVSCLSLVSWVPGSVLAAVKSDYKIDQVRDVGADIGSIGGSVTCSGFLAEATHEVFVDLQIDLNQPPVDTVHISCDQPYAFTDIPDGAYYVGAWLDENDSGDGPPDPGEAHEYYGEPDPLVISASNPTYTDIDIELSRYVERVSFLDFDSENTSISGDGRYVAFQVDDMTSYHKIYVYDREDDSAHWVDLGDGYDTSRYMTPDISADGQWVTFNLDNTFIVIMQWPEDPAAIFIGPPVTGAISANPSISADGSKVAFEHSYLDGVIVSDIYLYDQSSEETSPVSVSYDGLDLGNAISRNASISDDGRYVAFESFATDLVDPAVDDGFSHIYVRDLQDEVTELIPYPAVDLARGASQPSISADGRFVAYAYTYLDEDVDTAYDEIFVYDRNTGETSMVSIIDGEPSGYSHNASISGDGQFVAFETNRQDENDYWYGDIFVHQRSVMQTTLVTRGFEVDPEDGDYSYLPAFSADGKFVAFHSDDEFLVPGDNNQRIDAFVYENQILAAPLITSANETAFTVGVEGSFAITTSGNPMPSISISGTLPNGIQFNDNGDGTATLSGNPEHGQSGFYSLTITATNGLEPDAVQTFTLSIYELPYFVEDSTTFVVGTPESFDLIAFGAHQPILTWDEAASDDLPAEISVNIHDNNIATISGTPTSDLVGVYQLVFGASNNIGSVVHEFTLTIESGVYHLNLPFVSR
jgi:Tol biopolymer transport system component